MSRSIGFRRRPRPARARWPLYMLLDTLKRQGWGPLSGRPWKGLRAVLAGLAARLPYGAAQGATTIEQVAAAAGYGLRWTRQCLNDLESFGLISWERGGVRYGRPVPSFFRIDKAMLAELVEAARDERTAAMAAWAARTRARLERIRTIRMVRGRRKQESGPDSARAGARGARGSELKTSRWNRAGSSMRQWLPAPPPGGGTRRVSALLWITPLPLRPPSPPIRGPVAPRPCPRDCPVRPWPGPCSPTSDAAPPGKNETGSPQPRSIPRVRPRAAVRARERSRPTPPAQNKGEGGPALRHREDMSTDE